MTEREKLYHSIDDIEEIARNEGLDFFDTKFRLVPAQKMYEYGAYGLPGRFSHWTFGKAYYQMKTMYDYGLSKIYELVINTDPAVAFLMESNDLVENQAVAAHVFAHVDFFKNNIYFAHTDRQMGSTVVNHGYRLNQYAEAFGGGVVEDWLDHALTIQMNFDSSPRNFQKLNAVEYVSQSREEVKNRLKSKKTASTQYDDLLDMGVAKEQKKQEDIKPQIPFEDETDLLWMIAEFSPNQLSDWQKDVLYIVRSEQQYFVPQMQTKIMNEGWAAYWHQKIMRKMFEAGKLSISDSINFARMHSGVVHSSKRNINPYYIGSEIFKDIQRKYEGIPHHAGEKEKNWLEEEIDPRDCTGNPRYDIFRVRQSYNDSMFLRDYLPDYLFPDLDLYLYELQGQDWVVTEKDPEKIRKMVLSQMVNFGRPVIYVPVEGADYNKKRELYLKHSKEGEREVDMSTAGKTLSHIYAMWGRAVHLEAVVNNAKTLLTFDDGKLSSRTL